MIFLNTIIKFDPQLKKDAEGRLVPDPNGKGLTGTLKLDCGDVYIIETAGISQKPLFKSGSKAKAFVDDICKGQGKNEHNRKGERQDFKDQAGSSVSTNDSQQPSKSVHSAYDLEGCYCNKRPFLLQ